MPEATSLPFDWSIRRSAKATRIKVTVDADGVVVTLPESAPDKTALKAVTKLESWIVDRLADREEANQSVAARGNAVPWLGELTPLVVQKGRKVAVRKGGVILVPDGDHVPALESLFRREAKKVFTEQLDRITRKCGTEWSSLRIGDMRTRWGSCSPGGRMSFNWRLMLAPPEVLETVVWHEVCHIQVPNHSKRFWDLMDERRPGHREDAAWLVDHAAELMLAAPAGTEPKAKPEPQPVDEPVPVEPVAQAAPVVAEDDGEPGEQLTLAA
jgi:predicted metal-dependent hydrolase